MCDKDQFSYVDIRMETLLKTIFISSLIGASAGVLGMFVADAMGMTGGIMLLVEKGTNNIILGSLSICLFVIAFFINIVVVVCFVFVSMFLCYEYIHIKDDVVHNVAQ